MVKTRDSSPDSDSLPGSPDSQQGDRGSTPPTTEPDSDSLPGSPDSQQGDRGGTPPTTEPDSDSLPGSPDSQQGDRGGTPPTTELPPGLASLEQFVVAVKDRNDKKLQEIKQSFAGRGLEIENSYVIPEINACALLVINHIDDKERPRWWQWRQRSSPRRRQVMVWIGRRDLAMREPRFTRELWHTLLLARQAEGASGTTISERTRDLVVDMVYTVALFLLGALDVAAAVEKNAKKSADDAEKSVESILAPLKQAADNAAAKLNYIEEYLRKAALRKTFRYYLLGLPFGAALLALPIFAVVRLLPLANQPKLLISICIIGGGLGAITSVMIRITRGQKLEVDIDQGRGVTFVAGMFRPLVGATFGVALYVLVVGGLLPLSPDPQAAHFFGGLSFLAGFSERWAQDTILRSQPIAPSPTTTTSAGREKASLDDALRLERSTESRDEPPGTLQVR